MPLRGRLPCAVAPAMRDLMRRLRSAAERVPLLAFPCPLKPPSIAPPVDRAELAELEAKALFEDLRARRGDR